MAAGMSKSDHLHSTTIPHVWTLFKVMIGYNKALIAQDEVWIEYEIITNGY